MTWGTEEILGNRKLMRGASEIPGDTWSNSGFTLDHTGESLMGQQDGQAHFPREL